MVTQHACHICSGLNPYSLRSVQIYGNPLKKLCKFCQKKLKSKSDPIKQKTMFNSLKNVLGNYGYILAFFVSLWIVQVSLHRNHSHKTEDIHTAQKIQIPAVNAGVR